MWGPWIAQLPLMHCVWGQKEERKATSIAVEEEQKTWKRKIEVMEKSLHSQYQVP